MTGRTRALSRRRFLGGGLASLLAWALPEAGAAGAKEVDLICRRAWGARPPQGEFVKHRIRRITVHHSAVALSDNRDAPGRFRSHQADHMARGWPDIAYHVLIDRNGNVYRGRPPWARGDTSTDYDPTGHLLVLCEGNFDEQPLGWPQRKALVDVLAWGSERFGVPPWRIRGHRDYTPTACPGRAIDRLIGNGVLRRRVKERLARGGVRLEELCGKAGRRRVRRIEAGTD